MHNLGYVLEPLIVVVITFFAAFTQAVTGSGLALVAMPVLVAVLDPVSAAALVALMALTTQLVMLSRYRRALRIGRLWRLMIGSLVGIPLGVLALSVLDERVILTSLGVLLVGYSLYGLFNARLPHISNQRLGYGFGLVSGVLHGAYNTGGPPLVIFGMCSDWEPREFKGNLQALLMVNSSSVIVVHLLAGHYTGAVMQHFAYTLPTIIVAALVGFVLDRYLDAARFQKLVLVLLLVIGVKMLLG